MDLEVLLRAARDGEPGAWKALLPRLHRELRRYFQRDFDESTTDELMQRTVAILIDKLPGFDADESLRQWVFGVARNQRRMEYQSRTRTQALDGLTVILWPPNTSPSARVYAKEARAMLLEEIEKLPPHYRAIVENDLSGGDTKEFAERQNIAVKTVRTRRFRAIELLRHKLSARLEPPPMPAIVADTTSSTSTPPPT